MSLEFGKQHQEEADRQALDDSVKRGEVDIPIGTYEFLDNLYRQSIVTDSCLWEIQKCTPGGIVSLGPKHQMKGGKFVQVPKMNITVYQDLKEGGVASGVVFTACVGEGDRLYSAGVNLNIVAMGAKIRTPKFDFQLMMGHVREAFNLLEQHLAQ